VIATAQGWTDGQVLGAIGFLLFCRRRAGRPDRRLRVAANHLAYWWETRHTEHDLHRDLIDRVETYTLDPERVA
jgi:hypothetical protein